MCGCYTCLCVAPAAAAAAYDAATVAFVPAAAAAEAACVAVAAAVSASAVFVTVVATVAPAAAWSGCSLVEMEPTYGRWKEPYVRSLELFPLTSPWSGGLLADTGTSIVAGAGSDAIGAAAVGRSHIPFRLSGDGSAAGRIASLPGPL